MSAAPNSPAKESVELPRTSTADIIARLEAELARAPGSILASDADGTIWDGDVGIDIFEALLAQRGVREAARAALEAEAASIGVHAEGDPTAIAEALYAAYAQDRYAHDRAFAMMAWVFAGWHRNEVRAFAEEVLIAGHIERRIRPEVTAIFDWARSRSVAVFIVSASPVAIVQGGAMRLGIGPDRVAAMTPAIDRDGVLRAEIGGPVVYGEGKLHALEIAYAMHGDPHSRRTLTGSAADILGAFGDSPYDAAMLRAATVPVAVPPAPRLIALAPSIPGLLILDR